MVAYLPYFLKKRQRKFKGSLYSKVPVSVIIPAFNEEKVIEQTIKSMINAKPSEIIVIDDGSKDKTYDIAKETGKYAKDVQFKVLRNISNMGKAYSLNRGIKEAQYDYVFLTDADTTVNENTISMLFYELLEANKKNKKYVASTGCALIQYDSSTTYWIPWVRAIMKAWAIKIMRAGMHELGGVFCCSGSCSLFNRNILIEVGGFSEDTLVDDLEITWKLYKQGYKVFFVNDAYSYPQEPREMSHVFDRFCRWYYGYLVELKRYKLLFNPKAGKFGFIVLPLVTFGGFIEAWTAVFLLPLYMIYLVFSYIKLFLMAILSLIPMILFASYVYKRNLLKYSLMVPLVAMVSRAAWLYATFLFLTRAKVKWGKIKRY